MKKRAVFLDRDGTLIEERKYLSQPEGVTLVPGTPEALKGLSQAGYLLLVVTNQSGIGRGYYTEEDMHRVNARLRELLSGHGVDLAEIYYAPEAPEQPSQGRKPSPQFLWDAREAFDLALESSYMVGDKMTDLECGWNAGVARSILVRTGYGTEVERANPSVAERAWVVDNVAGAARRILEGKRSS